MEDSHTIATHIEGLHNHSFVAVYDGHGGSLCAIFAGKHMLT
jgi:serine/threonine protein phosphatase PrpC